MELHLLHFFEDIDEWVVQDRGGSGKVFYNIAFAYKRGFRILGHEGLVLQGLPSERGEIHASAAFGLAIIMMRSESYQKALRDSFLHALKKLSREVRLKRSPVYWVFFERESSALGDFETLSSSGSCSKAGSG